MSQLYKGDYTEEFDKIINEIIKNSFNTQIQYLEKVFHVIDNDINEATDIIKEYLKKNEKISYNWCMKFKMPIYSSRSYLIEELYNGQQVSFQ
jgi:hypothetical protein